MRSSLFLLAYGALLSTALAQQPVSFTGRLEPVLAPPACAPVATHKIEYTDVHIFSSTLNLNAMPSIPRRFLGIFYGGVCPLIDITSVENVTFSLSICNQPAVGCPVTIDLCPHPLTGSYLVWASLGTGFAPVTVATGSLLLNPLAMVLIASGGNSAVCQSIPLSLAGTSAVVGLDIFMQGAVIPTAGAPQLSNVTRMTILPPSFACTSFECY